LAEVLCRNHSDSSRRRIWASSSRAAIPTGTTLGPANLHTLGVDDKTIQAILRHSNVSLTINVYIKSVTESQVNAMDVLSARLEKETSNNLATGSQRLVN
jgi:hypothetical protein